MFDDLLEANRRYRREFHDSGMQGVAAKGLAVLTCIDSRIDPLALLGLRAGDAKIIRNAGARVTDDALRSLVLAVNLLGVTPGLRRAAHQLRDGRHARTPRCRRASERRGAWMPAAGSSSPWPTSSRRCTTTSASSRSCPLLPDDLVVGGFIFDVHTGELVPVDRDQPAAPDR